VQEVAVPDVVCVVVGSSVDVVVVITAVKHTHTHTHALVKEVKDNSSATQIVAPVKCCVDLTRFCPW